jgi:putative nucleotidyltransferase with HDIG domain
VTAKPIKKPFTSNGSRNFFRAVLIILTSIVTFGALVLPIALRPSSYPISIGSVASSDITAPSSATFESVVLTSQAKQKAADAVSPVYLRSDPAIARAQVDKLNILFNYISTVRSDAFSTKEQKVNDLSSIASVSLTSDSIEYLVTVSDSRWADIQQESIDILKKVMQNNIRDYEIAENQADIPNLIDLSFSTTESTLIDEFVSPFIVANSIYSKELTNLAKARAMETVQPVNASYIEGQSIVLRGQIISAEQYEALEHFGFVEKENRVAELLSSALIVLLMFCFVIIYFSRRHHALLDDLRSLTLLSFLFLVFLISARVLIPNRTVLPYFFPMAAFGLITATLLNLEASIIFSLLLSILATFGLSNSFELTAFYLFTSLIGSMLLGRGKKVSSFFTAGIWLSLAGCTVIAAFRYIDNSTDWFGMATLFGVTFMNGFASASIALLVQYIFAQMLGLSNPLHLIEISRPDHPLLQYVLQNAPGTYQHSLQVANLAEQGAEAIGADPVLTRVGALFHDCGKAKNPQFFIENQVPGNIDSHDDMKPEIAAEIIINHVRDGISLSEKYRLPPRIRDFIREHHGTSATRYQYCRAIEHSKKSPEKIDKSKFTYPGPKPRTKETALLMLADGCEAKARAELPKTDEDLRALIKKVIDTCMQEGQLEDSPLTLRDIKIISDTFYKVLQNIHHPRLKYPEVAEEIKSE